MRSRYNYQMENTLTWPPHDTDYIPTGAYSSGYKGPYDNDYDWPDDTQVHSPAFFPLHTLPHSRLVHALRSRRCTCAA
jgi:hypothetical protein